MTSDNEIAKPATIQDVADRCGVSAAVVSAALRGVEGTVRFSKATQTRVREAATELGYAPNRLAQAMRTGSAPIVAVSLHVTPAHASGINTYLHDILPSAGLRLHALGMEMLFVPFSDHTVQVERLRSLLSDRLIGGVISNNVALGHESALVAWLTEARLPYVIVGSVAEETTPCVAMDGTAIATALRRVADRQHLEGLIRLRLSDQDDALQAGHDNGHGGRDEDWMPIEQAVESGHGRALFIASGTQVYRRTQACGLVPPDRLVLLEDSRLWDGSRPAVLVRSCLAERAERAANTVVRWMQTGQPPRPRRTTVTLTNEDVILKM